MESAESDMIRPGLLVAALTLPLAFSACQPITAQPVSATKEPALAVGDPVLIDDGDGQETGVHLTISPDDCEWVACGTKAVYLGPSDADTSLPTVRLKITEGPLRGRACWVYRDEFIRVGSVR